jgi:peptidoglycan/xylan/chitin deacetylase (PgdA/CDA1 family)
MPNSASAIVASSVAVLMLTPIAATAQPAAVPGADPPVQQDSRRGIIVLQFDDGTSGHYTHAFRILEKYGPKGSFGVVTGVFSRPGRLTAGQVAEMHRAGHEIHDHTLDHNAAFWGNPHNREAWKQQIEQSLGILKPLGIATRGWNQPGGQGAGWTPELRETLAPYYDYVAGRVGLKADQLCNMHWNLKDDPFCLGYGGVGGWPMRGTSAGAAQEAERTKTQIADGLQQGLVTIPLFHVINDENGSAWGLEEICKFIHANKLPVLLMADAVRAVQTTRKHFDATVEQIPNPGFACDLDRNGRPDGYHGCVYAPAEVTSPGSGRVAAFASGTTMWIYGPEIGETVLTLTVRSADDVPRAIAPVLIRAEINDRCEYRWREPERCGSVTAGREWQTAQFPLQIGPLVDRVKIEFEVSPPGTLYVGGLSWRLGSERKG